MIGCNKQELAETTVANDPTITQTINKMVQVTNQQTTETKNQIAVLAAQNTKMSTEQYDGFVRTQITNYVTALIATEPKHLVNDGLQINTVDTDPWDNQPDVYGGSVEEVLPPHLMARIDKLALRLDAIIDNPLYDHQANINNGAAEIQNILDGEIIEINNDLTLNTEEKLLLTQSVMTASALVIPQLAFFRTLAHGAESLGEDMGNFRKRSFWGKLIRAVARVAIAIVAVTVATVLVIKAGILIAPFIKPLKFLTAKYGGKGFMKKILGGVKVLVKGKPVAGSWVATSSLVLGGGSGIIKAGETWNKEIDLQTLGGWLKEIGFKAKFKEE